MMLREFAAPITFSCRPDFEVIVEIGIVILVAVLVVGFLMFGTNIGKDPTKKSLPQLEREYDLHIRHVTALGPSHPKYPKVIEQMKRVEQEIAVRKAGYATEKAAEAPPESGLTTASLRMLADGGYNEGWLKAKGAGKGDRQAHEIALISALYFRLRCEKPDLKLPLQEAEMNALQMEALPFNVLPADKGRDAMLEYICWRDFPAEANESRIAEAIQAASEIFLENEAGADFVEGLRRWPFPWTRFLPQ